MFEIIDDLKNKLDQHRPLSPSIVKNLHEDLIVRWTYHSNAIEGNTLTLLETKVVLEGITVGGKALENTSKRSTIEMQFTMLKILFGKRSLFLNGKFVISISLS